ncbi:spc97 spc98 family domain-containing protein [Cyclospora cayetanensis]|uniref:Spc97 spc98 family domain-containing protein n=1 Tax=Cyclospora cayetanensis TaxID=88456 RepID=A0A1D3CYE3_9EIME|nr:spc97 spc98 family domain-containing protein [Cyclospora cayetanensis]
MCDVYKCREKRFASCWTPPPLADCCPPASPLRAAENAAAKRLGEAPGVTTPLSSPLDTTRRASGELALPKDAASEALEREETLAELQGAGVSSETQKSDAANSTAESRHLALSLSQSTAPAPKSYHPLASQANQAPGFAYAIWGIDEVSLLRDLLFVLQGIEGRFVRFDALRTTCFLCPTIRAPPSLQSLVARVSSLGSLYSRVRSAVEDLPGALLSPRSLTAEAFRQSVAAELRQYFKLLAVLEEDIARSEAAAETARSSTADAGTVTLRRLAVWLQGPYRRMRLLASMVSC